MEKLKNQSVEPTVCEGPRSEPIFGHRKGFGVEFLSFPEKNFQLFYDFFRFSVHFCEKLRIGANFDKSYLGNRRELRKKLAHFKSSITTPSPPHQFPRLPSCFTPKRPLYRLNFPNVIWELLCMPNDH